MLTTGLVSITFRKLSPSQIIDLVRQAGLNGIEWGGDIHVPHGDIERAGEVRQQTVAAGLRVAAYGSYYRAGHSENDGLTFQRVLDTAISLSAPLIRVWPGTRGSADADDAYHALVADDLRRIAAMAQAAGIVVATEFHGNTLTDTPGSARALLEQVDRPNLRTLWQPGGEEDVSTRLASLQQILPWLTNIHVFHWQRQSDGTTARLPLAQGEAAWREYLAAVAASGRDHSALIEFVQNEEPEQFLRDAAVLRGWVGA